MTEGSISVTMIVKNEEDSLPGALESVGALGDLLAEVCIYDTGSSDGTIDLARAWGARVDQGYWDDDFARARNAGLAMVRAPWALVLDADERVHVDQQLAAAALCKAKDHGWEALTVRVEDVRNGRVVNAAPSLRLFRPTTARYRNRIHENVCSIGSDAPLSARGLPPEAIRLTHHGYGVPSKDAVRRERNLRISELEVEGLRQQNASSHRLVQALLDRGRTRHFTGDQAGAVADWREAWSVSSNSPFRTDAGARLIELHLAEHDIDAARGIVEEMRRDSGPSNYLAWLEAQVRHAQGDHRAAFELLRKLERPVTALGEDRLIVPILRLRCLSAAACGEHVEGLGAALILILVHDEINDFGRLALLLWGRRPVVGLARVLDPLSEAQRVRLLQSARGTAVAASLADMWGVSFGEEQ